MAAIGLFFKICFISTLEGFVLYGQLNSRALGLKGFSGLLYLKVITTSIEVSINNPFPISSSLRKHEFKVVHDRTRLFAVLYGAEQYGIFSGRTRTRTAVRRTFSI